MARRFVTNVGLITSNGPHGNNVMAAEWTHNISYRPFYIQINVHPNDATADNIKTSREFGVNLAATDQNIASSIAGNYTGKEIDKVAVLKELGIEFYKAKSINALMIKGSVLNAECKIVKIEELGDHIMFVGEVIELSVDENKSPLLYHLRRYFKLGGNIVKPDDDALDKMNDLIEKHKKADSG